ncbi:MAG: hypothetical protein GF411_02870 [Candidatus Lokiarchaeota archaeon]|nr:hypothetical protein [Candidatus Lokiarchaeota archaeon]
MNAQRENYHIAVERRIVNVAGLGEDSHMVEFFDLLIDGDRATPQAFCRNEMIKMKEEIIKALTEQ